ncbi:MAG: ABC transporter ATP-binding protein, partial [bacterium]
MRLEFCGVNKSFGGIAAVRDFSLEVQPGELFLLLGPSGCGKTTCLRIAAGFETPDSGAVIFGGRDFTRLPPHVRNTGMVFQNYALFPHMTVARNVEYGLRFRCLDHAERKRRVAGILDAVRISGLAGRRPSQLSGGQQQRVALARALVVRPDVLLLDEPLSNLDAKLRVELRGELRRIHGLFRTTTLYVTHDQEEAFSLADRIAVMKDGAAVQTGTPEELYDRPANAFVASFLGDTNLVEGEVVDAPRTGLLRVSTPFGTMTVETEDAPPPGGRALLSIRPEHVATAVPGSPAASLPPFSGFRVRMRVAESEFRGGV